ncbi:unnamed protein product [Arabidopsis lyrata]|nr:unnamed protein product [Arabidopsis lyrata]
MDVKLQEDLVEHRRELYAGSCETLNGDDVVSSDWIIKSKKDDEDTKEDEMSEEVTKELEEEEKKELRFRVEEENYMSVAALVREAVVLRRSSPCTVDDSIKQGASDGPEVRSPAINEA